MKRLVSVLAIILLASLAVVAETNWQFLTPVKNARFVYVTSYDGPEFSPGLIFRDREAIATVQQAMRDSGYTLVYRPEQADMIIAVESRPSEDVLAVYSPESWRHGTYLWRTMGKNGFASQVLVRQLETALSQMEGKKLS
ncbi:MAG: hypothetical protein ACE14L_00505 [Terriglobales bacterium]